MRRLAGVAAGKGGGPFKGTLSVASVDGEARLEQGAEAL